MKFMAYSRLEWHMLEGYRINVVVPARDEAQHIQKVVSTIPEFVDRTIVVDDGSIDGTSELCKGVELIRLEGEGVGAAIDAGHQRLVETEENAFISCVMAGDGQMDPEDLEGLCRKAIAGIHHVKGDRTQHPDGLKGMPVSRRIGTAILAFLTSLACGRTIKDPQCGYTATRCEVLRNWNWEKSWKGYGYPNWWLMELTKRGYSISHHPVRAIYGSEKSGLKINSFMTKVSPMLFKGLHARVIGWRSWNPLFLSILLLYSLGWFGVIASIVIKEPLLLFSIPIFWSVAHLLDKIWVSQKVGVHHG